MWESLRIPIKRRVRQKVGHSVRGSQKAPLGYDLADMRQLEAGDSPRSISLPHLAKFGEFQVVEKRPDRRAHVVLLLDLSASQSLGTGMSKRECATRTVSRLGTACLAQGHAVTVIAFTERVEMETGFTTSRSVWQERMADIRQLAPRHRTTNPREALERVWLLGHAHTGIDLVFIVSDFLFTPPRRRLSDIGDLTDVVAVPIMDPMERKSDSFFGLVVLQDVESQTMTLSSGIEGEDVSRYLPEIGIERCILQTDEREHTQFVRLQEFFLERLENDEGRV